MKITLSGVPGSGKSSIKETLAKHYGLDERSTGDFMREMAKDYGFRDVTQFLVEYVSFHPEIDLEVDEQQRQYAQNSENFVLDAHIGFWFAKDALKIFLQCQTEIAARRIFEAKRQTESAKTYEESLQATLKRMSQLQKNFLNLYKVDIYDLKHFDIVIDTSNISVEEAKHRVITAIDQANQPKKY